ncbi:unnamed protein product [Amoebophrya sp. A120]|nr:unnamed protein product [Amoebophrya sp. A120]|eukprot:GSA120T00025433001.1
MDTSCFTEKWKCVATASEVRRCPQINRKERPRGACRVRKSGFCSCPRFLSPFCGYCFSFPAARGRLRKTKRTTSANRRQASSIRSRRRPLYHSPPKAMTRWSRTWRSGSRTTATRPAGSTAWTICSCPTSSGRKRRRVRRSVGWARCTK